MNVNSKLEEKGIQFMHCNSYSDKRTLRADVFNSIQHPVEILVDISEYWVV